MSGRYTFGDGDLAADRLGLVAAVFEPTSRALLTRADAVVARGDDGVGRAVDLGCGPGHTTRLVAAVCRPRTTLGLDASDRFVATARSLTDDPAVTYAVHDVTRAPLPGGPADLVHARLLLAHLPGPLDVVALWRSCLRPGGVLVLDEVEAIDAPPGVLRDYLAVTTALVAAEGAQMYAGRLLEPLGGHLVRHDVGAAVAARMFAMNLATWRADAIRMALVDEPGADRLAAGLSSLSIGPDGPPVRWTLRQLVLPGEHDR